jgi:hypothetical protein
MWRHVPLGRVVDHKRSAKLRLCAGLECLEGRPDARTAGGPSANSSFPSASPPLLPGRR